MENPVEPEVLNDRMPRLNMIRIKADHAAANDLRNNILKSAQQTSGETVVESRSFMINDKEQLRSSNKKAGTSNPILKPIQESKAKLLVPV